MAILLKTASVRVSSIQMQVRVQNKGKSVWKSRYDGDVSLIHDLVDRSIDHFLTVALIIVLINMKSNKYG